MAFETSSQQIFERKREIVLTLQSSGTGTTNLNPLQLQQFMNMLSITPSNTTSSNSPPRISEVPTLPSNTKDSHNPNKNKNKNRNRDPNFRQGTTKQNTNSPKK